MNGTLLCASPTGSVPTLDSVKFRGHTTGHKGWNQQGGRSVGDKDAKQKYFNPLIRFFIVAYNLTLCISELYRDVRDQTLVFMIVMSTVRAE